VGSDESRAALYHSTGRRGMAEGEMEGKWGGSVEKGSINHTKNGEQSKITIPPLHGRSSYAVTYDAQLV